MELGPSRRAEKRTKTRERIIDFAGRVFAERGYETVGLEEVAEAAGLARRTLYNYFKSKGALLEAVLEPAFQAGQQQVDAIALETDTRAAVRKVIEVFVVSWRDHRYAMRVAFSLRAELPTALRSRATGHVMRMHRVFERAEAEGLLLSNDA